MSFSFKRNLVSVYLFFWPMVPTQHGSVPKPISELKLVLDQFQLAKLKCTWILTGFIERFEIDFGGFWAQCFIMSSHHDPVILINFKIFQFQPSWWFFWQVSFLVSSFHFTIFLVLKNCVNWKLLFNLQWKMNMICLLQFWTVVLGYRLK